MQRRIWTTTVLLLLLVFIVSAIVVVRFSQGPAEAERQIVNVQKVRDLGATSSLVVLPLVERNAVSPLYASEPGVSYLVKTDRNTILFDVGANANGEEPSPLLKNMQELGITIDNVDTIVISHRHPDHVGGGTWYKENTFSLGNRQLDLKGKRLYVPEPMSYPGLVPVLVHNPSKLADAVATTGTLSFEGSIPIGDLPAEQSLAVNVQGIGIVLIIGCGHPTLRNIVRRAEAAFEQPVVGVIGGLHYADPAVRDAAPDVEFLRARHPMVVGLSPHDSSAASIQAFRTAFPEAYREIAIGQPITIAR